MRASYTGEFNFSKYLNIAEETEPILYIGHVIAVDGLSIESLGPRSVVGEVCTIRLPGTSETLLAEVVALEGTTVKLSAYGETKGLEIGCEVVASGNVLRVPVGMSLLGRVIDAVGHPCDGKGEIDAEEYYPALAPSPDPMKRLPVNRRVATGVRAIDAMLTVGKGQRLGIFAGSGVGKSSIISMIARNTDADVNVIGLIGERGREVLDFIKRDLGEDGLKKSVVVVATSDQSAICRLRAAYVTTAVAEYFRDQGKDVMLMFDSVTRFAQAQREIALSNGEPAAQKGYPPSVFDMIPKLLERAGTNDKGTITAFYTVLVDGDDMNEPISDKVRGTLDGHIILSRQLAMSFHYPAIDVLSSISRLSKRVTGVQTQKAVGKIRTLMALYEDNEMMITTGIYQRGNSPEIDEAVEKHARIKEFLMQEEYEKSSIKETLDALSSLAEIQIPQDEYFESPAKSKESFLSDYKNRQVEDSLLVENVLQDTSALSSSFNHSESSLSNQ